MALFTVYSLLLLAPLLHGLHSLCPEESYCPTGVDCSSNSSLCVKGTCEATPQQACLEGISCADYNLAKYNIIANYMCIYR